MRRDFFIHFAFWFFFFVLISIAKNTLSVAYWPFWVGGLFGLFLPDIDHLVYVFFLGPQELTSQRINFLLKKKEIGRTLSLLYETRDERRGLIFHTNIFQLIFLILTFLIVTSSTSVFATGLVLSFVLHLSIDQLMDLVDLKNLSNWGKILPFELDLRKSQIYWLVILLLICIMGFLM